MSSCRKCDKYNPLSFFSFLRTATRKKRTSNRRKTMKGGWRKPGSGKKK